jgi:hypothetical protein
MGQFLVKVDVVQESPIKTVNIKGKGNFEATLVYKLNDRPNKTTLVFDKVKSPLITGGGGSWQYNKKDNGTWWVQQGTCTLKNSFVIQLFVPFIRLMLKYNMRNAMKLAKKILEEDSNKTKNTGNSIFP